MGNEFPSVRGVLAVTVLIHLLPGLQAQGDVNYLRAARAVRIRAEKVAATTYLEVAPNFGQGSAVARWYEEGSPPISRAQVPLPFHRVGSGVRVAERSFLLSGLEFVNWNPPATRGVLCKLRFVESGSPPTYTIEITETTYLPTLDPVAIAWHPRGGRLFLLDHHTRTILATDWAGWDAPLPAESSFETAAAPSNIPLLADGEATVSAEKDGRGCYVMSLADLANHWFITKAGGTWQINPQDDLSRLLVVRYPALVSSRDDVVFRIRPPAASNWTLTRETDAQTIASGTASYDQWTAVTGTAQAFHDQPGVRYILEVAGPQSSFRAFVYPTVRYGLPQGTNAFHMSRAYVPYLCEVGDTTYGHGVYVKQTLSGGTVNASLWVAVRNGGDPVTVNGDVAVLDPQSTIDFQYDPTVFPTSVGLVYPIADDPALVGSVLLWQYVFELPGGDVASTEVFGTQIVAKGSGGRSMGSSSTKSSVSGKARLARAWRFIGATPDGRLPKPKRAKVARLRAKMLHR